MAIGMQQKQQQECPSLQFIIAPVFFCIRTATTSSTFDLLDLCTRGVDREKRKGMKSQEIKWPSKFAF